MRSNARIFKGLRQRPDWMRRREGAVLGGPRVGSPSRASLWPPRSVSLVNSRPASYRKGGYRHLALCREAGRIGSESASSWKKPLHSFWQPRRGGKMASIRVPDWLRMPGVSANRFLRGLTAARRRDLRLALGAEESWSCDASA